MLYEDDKGVQHGGSTEFICVLQLPNGDYHLAMFEFETPGHRVVNLDTAKRLRFEIRRHQLTSFSDLEDACKHVPQFSENLVIKQENVVCETAVQVLNFNQTWYIPNWLRDGAEITLEEALQSLNKKSK